MDFANLDLRTASERGSWVHFHLDGEPLYLDDDKKEKPCRIKIKGMGSDAVKTAYRKVERVNTLTQDRLARTADNKADKLLESAQASVEEAMAGLVIAAVCEWENIVWDGKPLEFTPDNVLKICGPGTLFFAQVNSAIAEAQRLFTNADSA